MTSLGSQTRFGFSAVELGFTGVPRFLVKGARTTRCLSSIFPLPILSGWKSIEAAPVWMASPIVIRVYVVGVTVVVVVVVVVAADGNLWDY